MAVLWTITLYVLLVLGNQPDYRLLCLPEKVQSLLHIVHPRLACAAYGRLEAKKQQLEDGH